VREKHWVLSIHPCTAIGGKIRRQDSFGHLRPWFDRELLRKSLREKQNLWQDETTVIKHVVLDGDSVEDMNAVALHIG
jgi:hypothetical protein